MNRFGPYLALIVAMSFMTSQVQARDFDWLEELNVSARSDGGSFRTSLSSRFRVGDAQVSAVIGDMRNPGDAYMVFRLGELSHQPIERVVDVYENNRGKGWGVIAKQLGIKPGSSEFHALKSGHDLGGSFKGKGGKGKPGKPERSQKQDREHGKKSHGGGGKGRDKSF